MIEILGCHKIESVAIMEKYGNTFNYSQLSLVKGIRYLTSNFLLCGETQGDNYFKYYDYLFTYTYAILLLNTDLFNKSVIKHTDEEREDDLLKGLTKQEEQQPYIGINSPYVLTNQIYQTNILEKERLNQFIGVLLDSIENITDFKKEYIKFAQIFFISLQTLRVNTDRLLKQYHHIVVIHYLKQVIEFLHQGESLENYYNCFQQGLAYLIDQSLKILEEFLIEIQKFFKQKSEFDFSINFVNNIVQLQLTIFTELDLDLTDAQIIMNLIQDIFEQIQKQKSDKKLVKFFENIQKYQANYQNKGNLEMFHLSMVSLLNTTYKQ
ncbi:unnamed protein product [Paramecium pentaurelia]|uniref:SEC7 domain-containing protein n=1 Tax=Paramecium pentaurelia TaxID=43138 RepID=A0A8S1UCG5_9CILI|nr:unnamed protein product [Paramecium pentaurelia]